MIKSLLSIWSSTLFSFRASLLESRVSSQGVILWLAGVAHGVAAIVAEMSMNQSCYGVQIAALRATQAIFDQLEHHSDSKELASRGQCIVAVPWASLFSYSHLLSFISFLIYLSMCF